MTPKLKFVYSIPLDNLFTRFLGQEYDEKVQRVEVAKFIKKLQKEWDKNNDNFFKEIEKAIGLNWGRKEFECFMVKKSLMSVSYPLITYVRKDLKQPLLTMVHELVHCNLANSPTSKYSNALKLLQREFKHYNKTVLRHIIVDLVLLQVIPKILGKRALDKVIKFDSKKNDYAKAWEIALEVGNVDGKNIWEKIRNYCK